MTPEVEVTATPGSPQLEKTPPQVARIHPPLFTLKSHLTPLWPSKLQFIAFLCLLIIILRCIVIALAPLTLGALITTFDTPGVVPFPQYGSSPWPYLITYVVLNFLSSSGGLAALRHALWTPIMHHSDRTTSILAFNHILALSLSSHTKRKSGELLHILDRVTAINRAGDLIYFTMITVYLDVAVAVGVFVLRFELTLGMVVGVVMVGYIWASVVLTRYRTKIRRQMNDQDVIVRGIHRDYLFNYETVKHFGGEEYEARRCAEAIAEYQSLESGYIFALNSHNLVQTLVITLGFLLGSIVVASRVTSGESDASDFVVFIAYYAQLYFPLSQFSGMYRSIDQGLIDTEKLSNLLAEPTEVVDAPDAKELVVGNGEVEFENVSFSYDGTTPVLKNASFKVPQGRRVMLVGESGAGKSTVLRLLYRLYDLEPGEGRILINGQDIRTVTLSSLRNAIGVVPQDPVLFNASIGYNIAYGRPSMTPPSQSTIIDAARAAEIHERIMSFPEGYETKVGERGVCLSEREKHCVAIARAIVKNPRVLLLDEATSALDGAMGRAALGRLVEGRSCLSIPHRLDTIGETDLILVLKEGRIAEQGLRKELSELGGLFASMWADQMKRSEEPLTYEAPVVDVPEPECRAIGVPAVRTENLGLSFVVSDSGSPGTSSLSASDRVPLAFLTTTSTSNRPSFDSMEHPERSHAQGVTFDAGAVSRGSSGKKVANGFQRIARRLSVSGGETGIAAKLSVRGHKRDSSTLSGGSRAASVTSLKEGMEEHRHVEKHKEEKKKKRRHLL